MTPLRLLTLTAWVFAGPLGCDSEPAAAPPVDLSGLEERIDALGTKLGAQGERLAALEQKLDAQIAERAKEPDPDPGVGGGSPDLEDPFAPEDPPKKAQREIPGASEAITCREHTEPPSCEIQRSFVDEIMANPAVLAKQARVVPHQRDGKTVGFKLFSIRRGTLPKLLLFKNGDTITGVNGSDLTSIDEAMALYTKLRRASTLTFSIIREDKEEEIEVRIVE